MQKEFDLQSYPPQVRHIGGSSAYLIKQSFYISAGVHVPRTQSGIFSLLSKCIKQKHVIQFIFTILWYVMMASL